jgi:branched-chain amino acid transport system substrate-binding protein
MTTRRGFTGTALVGAAAVVAVSLGAGEARAQEELRIGFIASLTGPLAQTGKDMSNGIEMYLDEVKYDFGGAKVKLIIEDDQGRPPVAVLKAEKLIRQDKVHLVVGGVLAPVGYAIAPISTREKVVYIPSIPAADDLTQRQSAQYPYLIRTSWTSSQPHHPLGQWACEAGYKKVVVVAADYAFGHEVAGGFQKAFEDCGGKVIQKVWPPLNTVDFAPYLPTIKADADAIFTLMVGPMPLQFPKQLAAAGIRKPVLGGGTSYDEFVLPFMEDGVVGHVSALHYSAALETPKNMEFVKKYRAKYGKVPSYYSENNYTTALMIHEVMKGWGGKFKGPEDFVKTLQAMKFDTIRGPVAFDEFRNPIQNIYIKKVEKKKMFGYDKDELWNTVIKTYPNVSQFWTYGKEKFLAQPVYSRDYPPCTGC